MRYTFGDSNDAARRLEVLSEVFEPATRGLLRYADRLRPKLALDLGCGPGYSTRLLAECVDCDRVVGLDNSEEFVRIAGNSAAGNVSFVQHDVTRVPFPTGPANLISCRLLLTHLDQPLDSLLAWGTQLGAGGLMLIEEVEWICTTHELFGEYLAIVEAMLRDQGGELYVGPIVDRFEDAGRLRRRAGGVHRLRVSNRDAARMFLLNLRSWHHRPFVRDNYSPQAIANIEAELSALAESSSAQSDIEWGMRHMVLERVAG